VRSPFEANTGLTVNDVEAGDGISFGTTFGGITAEDLSE
jgi:hypothetical protein